MIISSANNRPTFGMEINVNDFIHTNKGLKAHAPFPWTNGRLWLFYFWFTKTITLKELEPAIIKVGVKISHHFKTLFKGATIIQRGQLLKGWLFSTKYITHVAYKVDLGVADKNT